MNDNIRGLIRSVTDNDIQRSKAYVKAILASDNTESNRAFKNAILNTLNTPSNNLLELPLNIKNMLTLEDVSVSFNETRYVLAKEDEEVVNQILDIFRTNNKLSEYGINYLNSLLLHGESGCGKTMLGRYIAYKVGLPFAYVNFSHLISSYLGTTGKNIKDVFDYIRKTKCVLMLDEIDAIGQERGGKQEVGEMSRIVINLMQSLDTLDTGTIVIGATNRLDIIDKALLRRFSIHHEMCLPSGMVREQIFLKYMATIPDTSYTENDVLNFVKSTDGMSCAKIVNRIVNGVVKCLVANNPITGSSL